MTTRVLAKILRAASLGGPDDVLHSIVESLPARIFWKDRELRYLGCNTPFARDAGFSAPAELVGKTDFEMGWKAEAEAYRAHDRAVLAAGVPELDFEEPQTTPEGGTRWLSTSKVPLRDADGNIIGIIGIYEDVTSRKGAEAALRESEERNRTIIDAAMDGFWLATTEGRLLEANEAYCRMSGYSRAELLGLNILDLDVTIDPDPAKSAIVKKVVEKGELRFETRHRRKDGTIFDVEASVQYRPEAEAQLVIFLRDITEQKRAAEELRASEERHRSIIETAMDGFWRTSREGMVLEVNEAYCRMSGFRAEELLGRNARELSVTDSPEDPPSYIRRAMEEGEARFEARHFRKDLTAFDAEVSIQYRPQGGGQFVAFQRDITERKRAEEALRMSEERHRSILIASPDNITITDLTGRVVMISPAGLATMGYERETDVVGHSLYEFLVAEDQARAGENMALMFQGTRRGPEAYRGIRADGSVIDLEVNAEFIRSADGEPTQLVLISRDITERKQAEESLRLSLKEKESLLREVHHRVKNNLQVISSLLRLESSRADAPGTRRVLQDMQGRILSMAVLHETLYRSGLFGQVDLAGYLRQLSQQVFRANPTSARLNLELSPVSAEIDQAIPCGLILNELLTNSLKHAFGEEVSGEVKVTLDRNSEGDVRLGVADTGVGLPADFEARRGRSLGLQLVSDLARQIGGQLAIDPGPGAAFAVTFTPTPTHTTGQVRRPKNEEPRG